MSAEQIRPPPLRRPRRYQCPRTAVGPDVQIVTDVDHPDRQSGAGRLVGAVRAMWISSAVPIVASSLSLHPLIRFVFLLGSQPGSRLHHPLNPLLMKGGSLCCEGVRVGGVLAGTPIHGGSG